MPYFDPQPKKRREDFFDMDEELERFLKCVSVSRLTIVTGLRRYGKTSLILTGLNEARERYVFIDCRVLPEGMISLSDVVSLIEEELRGKSWARKLVESIEGVEVLGVRVRIRRDMATLARVLKSLDNAVLVIDEAQELRRSRHRFDALLAYLYDHSDVRIVVSGSQVGMLYRFLRLGDPDSPLFGRPVCEVRLRKLPSDLAREFLEEGFRQVGIEPPKSDIEKAIEVLDGVIGWLTFYGYSYAYLGLRDVGAILEEASKLALRELEHALHLYQSARSRYVAILKAIATLGEASWSEILRFVEAKVGKVPRNTFSNMLKNLVDLGIVERDKGYRIADPVLKHAISKYLR